MSVQRCEVSHEAACSSPRVATSNLAKIDFRWSCTVWTLSVRPVAICRFEFPPSTQRAIPRDVAKGGRLRAWLNLYPRPGGLPDLPRVRQRSSRSPALVQRRTSGGGDRR